MVRQAKGRPTVGTPAATTRESERAPWNHLGRGWGGLHSRNPLCLDPTAPDSNLDGQVNSHQKLSIDRAGGQQHSCVE